MLDIRIKNILQVLTNSGYEAFVVGGWVRDYLLNRDSDDYDITTNAKPVIIKELFKTYRQYDTGGKHGTITLLIDDIKVEITPYRIDLDYKNHRHPDNVLFTNNLLEDLNRRDFTINAILMDKNEKIIDLLNGIDDLNNHLIKTINNPNDRFNEDALRILRAIRFKAKLNFTIDNDTNVAIYNNKYLLNTISLERKISELYTILKTDNLSILNEYRTVFNTFINYNYLPLAFNTHNDDIMWALFLNDYPKEISKLFLQKQSRILIKKLLEYKTFTKDNLVMILSNFDNPKIYIEYQKCLNNIDLTNDYQILLPYIVNEKNLAISSLELMDLGYKNKDLGIIKKNIIAQIHKKNFTNCLEDIQKYLKRL